MNTKIEDKIDIKKVQKIKEQIHQCEITVLKIKSTNFVYDINSGDKNELCPNE